MLVAVSSPATPPLLLPSPLPPLPPCHILYHLQFLSEQSAKLFVWWHEVIGVTFKFGCLGHRHPRSQGFWTIAGTSAVRPGRTRPSYIYRWPKPVGDCTAICLLFVTRTRDEMDLIRTARKTAGKPVGGVAIGFGSKFSRYRETSTSSFLLLGSSWRNPWRRNRSVSKNWLPWLRLLAWFSSFTRSRSASLSTISGWWR